MTEREPSRAELDVLGGVRAIVGEEHALPGEQLFPRGIDGVLPRAAAFPADAEQIKKLLAFANKERLSVIPFGGGTQLGLGNPPERADIALSLARLDRIVAYEPADMTVTVQAGVTLETLQRHLARHEQCLPLDPALPGWATIGGIIAARAAGPLRQAFRSVSDRLLGITVVTADGKLAKAGGRVVKNVSGYEMGRLYAGSLGTLAVIVEATFKVQPRFEAAAAMAAAPGGLERAHRAIRALLDSGAEPTMLELLGPVPDGLSRGSLTALLERMSRQGLIPRPVPPRSVPPAPGSPAAPREGAKPGAAGASAAVLLIAGYTGTAEEVRWQLDEAKRRLQAALNDQPLACEAVAWELAHLAALKAHREDAEAVLDSAARGLEGGASGALDAASQAHESREDEGAGRRPAWARALGPGALEPDVVTCRAHVRASQLCDFLRRAVERAAAHARGSLEPARAPDRPFCFAAHAGVGIARIHFPARPGGEAEAAELIEALRAASAEAGGFLIVERAPAELKQRVSVFGPPGQDFFLHRGIKERMDPNRILNPGRFYGGL